MKPDHKPSFERVLTALRCEEADRVPVGEIWVDPEVKEAFMGQPVRTLEEDIAFWHTAGYDYITLDTDLYAALEIQQPIVTGAPNTASTYDNPRRDRNWVASDTGSVKDWETFEGFMWPAAEELDYTPYDRIDALLPEGMGVIATTGHIFTAAWQLMGFEHFCLMLYTDRELVTEVMMRLGEETMRVIERLLAYDCVGALCYQDDIAYTSGLMISPQMLDEFFFPWLVRTAELCRASGVPLIYHSDGKLDDVLPTIINCGVDAIQAIEPKCMDIVAVKQKYGDRLALMGNVDLGYTLTRGTPQDVEQEVRHLIKHVAPGGGLLLGSTNSITNYVPLENYLALLNATFRYGRYPITL